MRVLPLSLALASAIALAACRAEARPVSALPVPVDGRPHDLQELTGEWSGEFRDEHTGRHGTISFALQPGRDTAYVRLVLIGDRPLVLRLGRLALAEGSVGGWVMPYPDPAAGHPLDTWFEGLLHGDVLGGVYFTRAEGGDSVRQGTWEVRRRLSP